MPYRKKTTKRRAAPRRRNVTAKRVARLVKQMRPEVKELTYPYSNVNGANFSSISFGSGAISTQLCNGISQGVTDGQRIGNRVKLIGVKIYFPIQNAGSDLYNQIRFLLIRPKTDRLGVGGTLIQNVFSGTVSGPTQWASPVDTERYKVYMDKVYNIHNIDGGSSGVIQPTRFLKRFFKLNASVQWDDEGNIMRDFLLIGISDSGSIPNPGVIAGHVKLYYTDN